jgi:hypothetical protein
MPGDRNDVTGFRGEKIVELRLTDYRFFRKPLFRPAFLGEKFPSIDFYVELRDVRNFSPYFFGQVKSTVSDLTTTSLRISSKRRDISRLLKIPGPTYIFGVHEPTQTVFVKAVHTGVPIRAITRISRHNRLTPAKLRALYEEVRQFWRTNRDKPDSSVFL